MTEFPYRPVEVAWKRPPIDRDIFRRCTRRNDLAGLLHCLGILALLGTTGAFSYYMFASQRWLLMALGLYIHGGVFAFNPQTHELAHGTLFKRRWLNSFFKRVFGLLHWTSNSALYWMSHQYHHRYTTHRASDGEVVLPRPETTERIFILSVSERSSSRSTTSSFFATNTVSGLIPKSFSNSPTVQGVCSTVSFVFSIYISISDHPKLVSVRTYMRTKPSLFIKVFRKIR